jgi:DNA replication and repair protein RecF
MNICSLRVRNFRNHADSRVEFGEGINLLLGNNGQGKTNLLEAISYLSLTKSFYAASDETVLQIGKDTFDVEGRIRTAAGVDDLVRCRYTHSDHRKTFTINSTEPETLWAVIGRFPVVILSPENSAITSGGPAERRKFLDLFLSQVSRGYFEDLLEYRRIVKQRNRVLSDFRAQSVQRLELLEPWNEGLVRYGSRVTRRRLQLVRELEPYVLAAHRELVSGDEEPTLAYTSALGGGLPETTEGEIEELLRAALHQRRLEELRRGTSLVGPHRDELTLILAGKTVREYASQGQHKTLLIALKLAEFFYLRERRFEAPMFLLDDLFSELDALRSARILKLVSELGQTVLTATGEEVLHRAVHWGEYCRKFSIEGGTCRPLAG